MNLLKIVDGKWWVDGRKFHDFMSGTKRNPIVKRKFSDFFRGMDQEFSVGQFKKETKNQISKDAGEVKVKEVISEFYFDPQFLIVIYHLLRIHVHKERVIHSYVTIKKEARKRGFRFECENLESIMDESENEYDYDDDDDEEEEEEVQSPSHEKADLELGTAINVLIEPPQKEQSLAVLEPIDGFVDARKLHEYLEIKTRFNDWIERRVVDGRFKEAIDYKKCYSNLSNPNLGIDYLVSIDMAKHLGQMEHNDKGFKVRQFFIDRDKEYSKFEEAASEEYVPSSNMRMIKSIVAEIEDHGRELQAQGKEIQKLTSTVEKIKETTQEMVTETVIHEVKSQFTKVIRSIEMPEGTKSLPMIQKQDLPGVSEAKISLILSSYQHPQIKWVGEKNGQAFETPLFFKEGLKGVVDRVFQDSLFSKETPEAYWFEHKGGKDREGNIDRTFIVKKECADKHGFFFNWLQYHSDFSMDQKGNLIVPESRILQLRQTK